MLTLDDLLVPFLVVIITLSGGPTPGVLSSQRS